MFEKGLYFFCWKEGVLMIVCLHFMGLVNGFAGVVQCTIMMDASKTRVPLRRSSQLVYQMSVQDKRILGGVEQKCHSSRAMDANSPLPRRPRYFRSCLLGFSPTSPSILGASGKGGRVFDQLVCIEAVS